MKLNLTANGAEQTVVKEYLEQNASDILAEKINHGVVVEQDGKKLLNRKTLDGFMKFAAEEARKQAQNGATSACVQDNVVFGWAIHYFEEDSIVGTLFHEDGSEYKKPKPTPKKAVGNAVPAPMPTKKAEPVGQMSFNFTESSEEEPEAPSASPPPSRYVQLYTKEMSAPMKIDTSTGEVTETTPPPTTLEERIYYGTDNEVIDRLCALFDNQIEIVR